MNCCACIKGQWYELQLAHQSIQSKYLKPRFDARVEKIEDNGILVAYAENGAEFRDKCDVSMTSDHGYEGLPIHPTRTDMLCGYANRSKVR